MLLFAVIVPIGVGAQDTGMVEGRVTDRLTGHVIAGAVVSARSPSGLATTKTDRDGFYVFMSLPTAATSISAVRDGYSPFVVLDVCVQSDQLRYVTIDLYSGGFHTIASIRSTYPQWRCLYGGD